MMVKDELLRALRGGAFVSGEALACRLGVSRGAVWKAVRGLETDGCLIESRPRLGYRLVSESGALTEAGVRAFLDGIDARVFVYDEIDSTNAEAKRLLARGEKGPSLLVAGRQSAGRGRLGRSFYSPADTGLYMTLLFPCGAPLAQATLVTAAAAVAVVRALESLSGARFGIKWVNDVYYEDKKVCGILTEAVSDFETGVVTHAVIGVGVNVSTQAFPAEIADRAGRLPVSVNRNELAARIARELLVACAAPDDPAVLCLYRERSVVLGRNITYTRNGETHTGVAREIDSRGALIVLRDDGETATLDSGEITLRIQK